MPDDKQPTCRLRWYQFRIRALLLLTLLVAVTLGWQRQRISQWIESLSAGSAENRTEAMDALSLELLARLKQHFPNDRLTVRASRNKVVLSGVVEREDAAYIGHIIDVANDYYPEVINEITVRSDAAAWRSYRADDADLSP